MRTERRSHNSNRLTHSPTLRLPRLDLASAHIQTQQMEEGLRVAAAAVDLAATTQSERVLGRARQFRRTVARAPQGLLREFDERLRAAGTRERTIG